MRASMEYLLCGLPVVSTPSIGGRDRYFRSDYAVICEPNPRAVADAVKEASARNVSRAHVRRAVLDKVAFDRASFLRTLNALIGRELKSSRAFAGFDLFRGLPIQNAGRDAPWLRLEPRPTPGP